MKYLLPIFTLLSIINLIGIGFQCSVLIYCTKPLLIPMLTLWYYCNAKSLNQKHSVFFTVGLIFSTIGDILLMLVASFGEIFFLAGLFGFLIAHLNYIMSFTSYPKLNKGLLFMKKWLSLLFILTYSALAMYLKNSLGAYMIPVLVYAFAIIMMAASSLNMRGRTSEHAAKLLSLGSLLFVLSDLVIAIKKFKYPAMNETLSGLIIMSTYLLGQYCMARGMAKATK